MAGKSLLNEDNAQALIELLADPDTPPDVQIRAMNRLIDTKEGDNFFKTMFSEMVSYGSCPCCEHSNHWLIPEDELNKMGWSTPEQDPQVAEQSRAACERFEEACLKRKTFI